MRIPALVVTLGSLVAFVACGGGEEAPATMEEEAPATMEEEAPAAEATPDMTIADFAGTWELTSTLENSPDPVETTLQGSADGSDWVMLAPERDPIPLEVSMSGDSLVTVTAPYESLIEDGVTVTVRTASVMQDGRLVGNLVATYQTPEGEREVTGTLEGTRGM